jgi:tRNA threonylcarbamoyladenosine biosynthesis protein TsaB
MLVLGVDTCGASGTVALARVWRDRVEVLGQTELAGKTYSSTLVAAVEGMLTGRSVGLKDVGAIVVVHGPGSFTGVRVGLSAVKGLAEPRQIPIVAVSRLAVLATKAGVGSAALDAHRREVFLQLEQMDKSARKSLAGAEDLSKSEPPTSVAVCDDSAAELLRSVWKETELVRTEAPTAVDAIRFGMPWVLAGEFVDLALMDGYYLRQSDAEIFGEAAKTKSEKGDGIRVRRMEPRDIDGVMEIAAKTDHAPGWGRSAYEAAIDAGNQPRRVALVAERGAGEMAGFVVAAILPGGEAELESIVTAQPQQRRGVARELFASLKHELRRQGVREVMLEVREANCSAQAFYRYLGFREEGRRPGYYSDPAEDAVLMRVGLR